MITVLTSVTTCDECAGAVPRNVSGGEVEWLEVREAPSLEDWPARHFCSWRCLAEYSVALIAAGDAETASELKGALEAFADL